MVGVVTPLEPRTEEEWRTHPIALDMPEKNLQSNIMALLRLFGWRAFHAQISYGSQAGFPDVCAVRASDGRLLFAELKRQKPKPTIPQQQWLDDLEGVSRTTEGTHAPAVPEVYLWRPSDWLSGNIERVLR